MNKINRRKKHYKNRP